MEEEKKHAGCTRETAIDLLDDDDDENDGCLPTQIGDCSNSRQDEIEHVATVAASGVMTHSACSSGNSTGGSSKKRQRSFGHLNKSHVSRTFPDSDSLPKTTKCSTANNGVEHATKEHTESAPFRLFATESDQTRRRKQGDRTILQEGGRFCETLREMLGLDGPSAHTLGAMRYMVIANYCIDFDFLLDQVPELLSLERCVVFYGTGTGSSLESWRTAATSSRDGSCAVDFVPLSPSDPPRSTSNPLPFTIPYGVHHTKMFLIGYSSGTLRVVIHTANLLYGDINIKTQGGYIQDFQRKAHSQLDTDVHRTPPNSRHKATSQFEDDLVSYIDSYRYTGEQMWESSSLKRHTLADQIRLHDFSCARGILIPSIPGRHNVQRAEFGYLKLNRVISHHIGKPQRGDNVSNTKQKGPLIAQCSSLGSLTQKWLNEFTSSLGGNEARHLDSTKLDSSKLKIVWPTVDEIRDSVEGYLGGGSVPGTTKNVSKDFLQPLYHRWGSTENPFNRSFTVPHIKTYMQLSEDESSIEWFVLSSHNLSKAAWGEVQNGKFGKCLFMRHWELGVLFLPGMFSKIGPNGKCNMKTFQPYSGHTIGKNAIPLPLPYCLPPKPYRPKDVPWAVDKEYPAPDSFGRRGLI